MAKEKEFTVLRDQLSQLRRDLPWEAVTKNYEFDAPEGKLSLTQLFGGRSQLLIYHFMLALGLGRRSPPRCSFWADNFDGVDMHLAHRDIT